MKKKRTTPATPQLTGEIYPSEKGLDAAAKKIQQLAPFAAKGPQTAAQINRQQTGPFVPVKPMPPSPEIQQTLKAADDPAELARLARHQYLDTPIPTGSFCPAIDTLTRAVQELRRVRDDQTYLRVGCHSFREFCVQQFGEQLGGFIEGAL